MLRKNLLFTAVAVIGFAFAAGCGSPASSVRQTESGVVPQYESSAQTQDDASAADTAAADSTSGQDDQTGTQTQAAPESTAETQASQAQTSASGSTGITEEDAKATALADAGIGESDVTRIRVKKDRDDGRNIYEVEFYVDREEYDYDIDADTGTILSKDFDIDDDFYQNSTQSSQSTDVISENDAIAVVLERVEGASASDVWIKLDYDDGRAYYEGEIYYDNTEYEFELDAYTGEVIEWSQENYRD